MQQLADAQKQKRLRKGKQGGRNGKLLTDAIKVLDEEKRALANQLASEEQAHAQPSTVQQTGRGRARAILDYTALNGGMDNDGGSNSSSDLSSYGGVSEDESSSTGSDEDVQSEVCFCSLLNL